MHYNFLYSSDPLVSTDPGKGAEASQLTPNQSALQSKRTAKKNPHNQSAGKYPPKVDSFEMTPLNTTDQSVCTKPGKRTEASQLTPNQSADLESGEKPLQKALEEMNSFWLICRSPIHRHLVKLTVVYFKQVLVCFQVLLNLKAGQNLVFFVF